MMKLYVLILFIILTSCINSEKYKKYSIPNQTEINAIIEAVIYQHSNLFELIIKSDIPNINGGGLQDKENSSQNLLSIDLRKLKVIIPDENIVHKRIKIAPPPQVNKVSITKLLKVTINGTKFFKESDSSFLFYQNDTLHNFVISKKISKKYRTTTLAEQEKTFSLKQCNSYYDLTIPLISTDNNKAYIELTFNSYYCGGVSYAIFLEKQNDNWRIIHKYEISVS